MVYSEKIGSVGEALKREAEIKRWKRAEKLALINKKESRKSSRKTTNKK